MRASLFAAPGVALAIVGISHPHSLTFSSSARWTVIHVVGLVVFPLVGAALAGLVWRRVDPLALLVVVGAYVYACAYTALDVIAGVAAGYVSFRSGPDTPRPDEVGYLFDIGNQLGTVGGWALLGAATAVAVDQVSRHRLSALVPSLLLVGAAVSFLDSHIYPWRGVVTVLTIGVATGWLASMTAGSGQNNRADGSSIPRRAS